MSSLEIFEPHTENSVSEVIDSTEISEFDFGDEMGLSLSPDNKNVQVERDSRYTTIYIDKKLEQSKFNEKFSDLYLKVKIKKDRVLKTTHTHIQKMFVSYEDPTSEEVDVIIRDIYVDRARGKSKRDSNTARTRMKRSFLLSAFSKPSAPNELPLLMIE